MSDNIARPTKLITRNPCAVHAQRESVGRCMICSGTFCRECFGAGLSTSGQLVCTACQKAAHQATESRTKLSWDFGSFTTICQIVMATGIIWYSILLMGKWVFQTTGYVSMWSDALH